MKQLLLFFIAGLCIQGLSAQSMAARLETFMDAAYKARLFNGVVLAAQHDTILLAKGYGWRDYEHRVAHDTNSVFLIGSVTKQFTAAVILYLQEQGKLNVTDKLDKYFPNYPYAREITIRNLLTHTSGVPEYSQQPHFFDVLTYKPYTQKDFWQYIKSRELDFDPDTEYAYSNSNYFILGYLIEMVTGKSYEQNMRDIIFDKAGMVHSGFDFKGLNSPYRSVGYDVLNDSLQYPARVPDPSAAYAAGGIYTTVHDLYRWYKALMTGKIISAASLQEAFTPYKEGYGYGFGTGLSSGGIRLVGHNGGIMGFQASLNIVPDKDICFLLLTNNGNVNHFPDAAVDMIQASFMQILVEHNTNYYVPRMAIPSDPKRLSEYIGAYQKDTTVDYHLTITQSNGALWASLNGKPANQLFEEKKDFFFLKAVNCQVQFTRNKVDKIDGLLVYFNHQKTWYRKKVNSPAKKVK